MSDDSTPPKSHTPPKKQEVHMSRKERRKFLAKVRRHKDEIPKTVGMLKSFTGVRLSTYKKKVKDGDDNGPG